MPEPLRLVLEGFLNLAIYVCGVVVGVGLCSRRRRRQPVELELGTVVQIEVHGFKHYLVVDELLVAIGEPAVATLHGVDKYLPNFSQPGTSKVRE